MQSSLPLLTLRKYSGNKDDQILLWQWRNDVAVRRMTGLGMVSLYDFSRSLDYVSLQTFIGYVGDEPVGYAQLEVNGDTARMFWMIDKDQRRKGLGPMLALEVARHARGNGLKAFVRVQHGSPALAYLYRVGFTHTGEDGGKLVMTYAAT